MNYLTNVFNKKTTPQTQPIPGTKQTKNDAGGFVWGVSDWVMLRRFLVLGAEGPTYYASAQTLSRQNALAVSRCIKTDGERVVREIVSVSQAGAAPKNDPAIFALALAAAQGDAKTKAAAYAALLLVCRTGTHLLHFAAYSDGMRGWGRGLRRAIARWYNEKPVRDLAYQVVKYNQRDGWTHRDLLRLAHVRPAANGEDAGREILTHYIANGWPGVGDTPHPNRDLALIWAQEKAKRAKSVREIVALIANYDLPREAIPTVWLQNASVWEALLPKMGLTALIRNLATLTRLGVLNIKTAQKVGDTITNAKHLKAARVHPLALLSALKTYEQGHGERGKNTWTPLAKIVDALDTAFYASFGNVESTNKRWLLALDVSGSMGAGLIAGTPGLSPRVASAALALLTASTENAHQFVGFCDSLRPLTVSPRQRLDDVIRSISNLPFGATDCALPMIWAQKNKVKVDVFAVYTDSETYFGKIHPVQALQNYRQATGIAAKLIVVGMVANKFTIADPNDGGMLDVVGFDLAAPNVMADFARQ